MKKIILLFALMTFAFIAKPVHAQNTDPEPIVHAVMLWMDSCPHCEDVIQNALPPLREKYDAQFELLMIEVVTTQDVDTLYRVAASYNIPKEQTGVPFLIIGDQVLVGSDQVREQLPIIIEDFLASGGMDWPANPILADVLPASSTTSNLPAFTQTIPSSEIDPALIANMQSNGFMLAIVIMVDMAIALLYSIISFAVGKPYSLPTWADWLIPALIILGIGVAGYLSYVETQSVSAICGPVGDCNAIQNSRYAKLFGVLPIGVLGLAGYPGLLGAWLVRKYLPRFEKPAAIGYFGMAFFAVIFSLYLTFLEPFVIQAVCIWCLSSAVIVTLLLLLGLPLRSVSFP